MQSEAWDNPSLGLQALVQLRTRLPFTVHFPTKVTSTPPNISQAELSEGRAGKVQRKASQEALPKLHTAIEIRGQPSQERRVRQAQGTRVADGRESCYSQESSVKSHGGLNVSSVSAFQHKDLGEEIF